MRSEGRGEDFCGRLSWQQLGSLGKNKMPRHASAWSGLHAVVDPNISQ